MGLILTNRHITGVGPVRAIAIFDRHEELEAPLQTAGRSMKLASSGWFLCEFAKVARVYSLLGMVFQPLNSD